MQTDKKANTLFSIIDEMLRLQNCFEHLFVEVECLSHLSTLQKLVLFAVLDAPVTPTVPQIGRNLGHSRQVVQRIVNELVADDLLEKADNPHHRRAALLVPTQAAEELRRRAEKRAIESASSFLETVNAERCEALTNELGALRKALQEYTQTEEVDQLASSKSSVSSALAFF